MSKKDFVKNYALNCYDFEKDYDAYLVAKLIHKYARGKRILDLGCGPVMHITSLFLPNAKEVLGVDILKENIEFVKNNSHELQPIIEKALKYKHRYISKKDANPKIKGMIGDVTKKLSIGQFDSVMQIGCFGALDTEKQFQNAVSNAYSYLKKGGNLLLVNWVGNAKRHYNFNGKVSEPEVYKPCLEKAGFKIKELHLTSKLSSSTKKTGYRQIIWAVAKK